MTEQHSAPKLVAVLGANGRMGAEAVKAVDAAPDMKLVAALGRGDSLEQLTSSGAQYVVDLTVPESTEANVRFAVEHGMHAVVGTTGWDAARLSTLEVRAGSAPGNRRAHRTELCLGVGAGFSFRRQGRPVLRVRGDHRAAPPGQGGRPFRHRRPDRPAHRRRSARAAQVPPSPDATTSELAGARGCEVDGVRVHSVRLRGLVAHQEVLLGGPGEQLTIRHDSFDRASFMPGVLLGVRKVASHPGLTVGLDGYLDLGL